jgi:nitrous oxidase accessory protein
MGLPNNYWFLCPVSIRAILLTLVLEMAISGSLQASDTICVGSRDAISKAMGRPLFNARNAATIKGSIEMSSHGDVLLVAPGTYEEGNIVIPKKLTLIGIDYPIVDGSDSNEVFTITADSVILKGFRIQNCGVSYVKEMAGIRIDQHGYCLVEGNKLINTFFGVYLKNAKECIIRNNYIEGDAKDEFSSGNAVHLWYSKNITVEGNTCLQHRDGIYLEFVEYSTVTGNHSERNLRYGLHFMFSNNDSYLRNTFKDNGAGVAVMFSHHITMHDNHFEKNWGSSAYGLLLKDISDGEIKRNTFTENTVGIYGDGANRLRMEGNEFRANGWALKILGSCTDNVITGNNFLDNTFDVITNTSINRNTYNGNYWSEYTGYDLDRDQTGDVPYKPVKLFSFITSQVPSAIILLRSPFVDLVNFAEKVMPSITPETLEDLTPVMSKIEIR